MKADSVDTAHSYSPAFSSFAYSLLEDTLANAADPGRMKLVEQLRELTGARLVVLARRRGPGGGHELVAVEPQRRRALAESPAMLALAAMTGDMDGPTLWEKGMAPNEAAALLEGLLGPAVAVPLRVGRLHVGALLLFGLPHKHSLDQVIDALGTLSRVVALVLRNAALYKDQEATIAARTRELAEEHARLEVTLRSIGDAVIAADIQGRVTFINPVAEGLTGWQEAQAQGRPLEEVFLILNEETRQPVENPVARVMREGRVVGLANHTLLVARDGTERPIADSGAPMRDAQGEISGVVLVFRDQTEERAVQETLRESEEKYRGVFENALVGVGISSAAGKVLAMNQAMVEITGYSLEEFSRVGFGDTYVNSEDRERFFEIMKRKGVVKNFEVQLENKEGERYWASLTSRPITYDGEDAFLTTALDITGRVKAGEVIKRREAQLSESQRVARLGSWDWDVVNNTLKWSDETFRRFDTDPEEFTPSVEYFVEHIQPPDREKVQGAIRNSLEDNAPYHVESWVKNDTGREWVMEAFGVVERNEDGKPLRMKGTAQDVTERVRADEKFRIIFESAPDAYYLNDLKGNFIDGNRAAESVTGFRKDELIGKSFLKLDLLPKNQLPRAAALLAKNVLGQPTGPDQFTLIRKDGRQVEVEIATHPVKLEGRMLVLGIARDITERKLVETRIANINLLKGHLLRPGNLEQKMTHITDLLVETFQADFARIWIIRPGDRCDSGCIHAQTIAGPNVCRERDKCLHLMASSGRYTHTDGEGHSRVPFGAYKIGNIVAGNYPKALTNDVANDSRISNPAWARELGLVSFAGYRLTASDGEPIGVMTLFSKQVITADIDTMIETVANTASQVIQTLNAELALREYSDHLEEIVDQRTRELRDAQERLIRQERLAVLGELAGGVGHELRNPLGVITNAIYYLNMATPEADAKTQEYLQMIDSEAKNAAGIVSDLLDYSRVKSGERSPAEVSELVAAVISQHPAPDNVTLSVELPADLPPALVDARQIEQVLSNLVTNAYQAMPEGGRLTIDNCQLSVVNADTPMVAICIRDTGSGIAPENKDKLFEPLFTTKSRGIGLGLAVSKKLVEANGGTIEVSSEGVPGKGSRFILWLPVVREA